MVDKILFTPWYEVEKRDPMNTSQKTGWSPFPGGYQRLLVTFPKDESIAVDKAQWDWTMPGWVISAYVELKKSQMVGGSERYWKIAWNRLSCVLGPNAYFRMCNGVEWRQEDWGIMKSGFILTLSLNSAAQVFQHALAWKRMGKRGEVPIVWAMGDDILARMRLSEEEIREYWKALESTGCRVKKIERSREFCGFDFVSNEQIEPLYPDKHQFIMRSIEQDPELEQQTLLSYALLYSMSNAEWVKQLEPHHRFVLGLGARAWAKGLIQLELLAGLPVWTEY